MLDSEETDDDFSVLQRVDDVTDALSELASLLDRESELGQVLQLSVDQVTQAIPAARMASVSLLLGDVAETVAATSDRVCAIDSDQYAAGEGPCLEAARSNQIVRVSVEQVERRWPDFARSARAAGVLSYLSCPLVIDEKFAGSLNVYSDEPHGFADLDEALLRLYITAATAAIVNARRYAQARSLAENLRRALDSRSVIDQAIGVRMAATGVSAQEALDELSRESQDTNTKLRVIAARIVREARKPR
jgi:GAF domain-containing protein